LWAWHQHETDGAVESVCVIPEGNSDALYAVVKRVINNTTKRFVERMAKGDSDYVAAGTYLDCATVVEAEGSGPEDLITSVTGLSYLQGAYVSMLADNKVIGPVKLNGSSMSVPSGGALRVVVGLPYNSDAELLDLVPGRTRLKSVVSAAFEVEATSGIQAGEDFDHLTTVNEPSVSVAPKGTTGLVEVIIASAWNKGGRAVIRQSKPFQCHILSAIRQIEVGGA
jgi:hypothetical protein